MKHAAPILLAGLLLLLAGPVYAHAALVSAEPASGATVTAVSEIRLTFSEPLGPGSTFSLFTDGFQPVSGITPQVEGNMLRATLATPLAPGTYTVQWKAISTTSGHEGHEVEGSYQWRVAEQSAPVNWVLVSGVVLVTATAISLIGVRLARRRATAGGQAVHSRRSILLSCLCSIFCLIFVAWPVVSRPAQALPDYPPAQVAPGNPLRGRVKYGVDHVALCGRVMCATCHGVDGRGIARLGPNLINSPLVRGLSDAQLVTFIALGRSAQDPASHTGVAMPPRGGNPMLTDQDLADIVAYLRTLQR